MVGKLFQRPFHHTLFIGVVLGVVVLVVGSWGFNQWALLKKQLEGTKVEKDKLLVSLTKLQNEDQYKRNEKLQGDIHAIETTYKKAVATYEDLLDLRSKESDTSKFDDAFARILTLLSERNYGSASSSLATLQEDIKKEEQKLATAFTIPSNVPESSTAPSSGNYSRQSVPTDAGTFLVDIIAADVGSTRVIVDTASDGTCTNDCPVLPLASYVSRNGAYAGVNGSYFCPADYPSCAERKNSFDTLLMNKNKIYFNSDNNTYSTVPAVIFGSGFIRFVGQSLEWGRDTSIDSMIAMQPMLVSGGNIAFGGNSDPKEGSKGSRSFVANKGNTVYIGVVRNATVAESARVMKALGMDNALNLDDGGSTALWYGGYKVGPGRSLPNVVLFVKK